MGVPALKFQEHKKGTHSPVSPKPRKISDRLLRPLSESTSKSVTGRSLYENKKGEVFSATTMLTRVPKSLQVPLSGAVIIEEVGGAYRVIAKFHQDNESDSLYISYIHNSSSPKDFREPSEERKGYGFFGIIVEHAKRVAREFGLITLSTRPTNSRLKLHYEKSGFEGQLRWMTCKVG